jgi:hypothetical protein
MRDETGGANRGSADSDRGPNAEAAGAWRRTPRSSGIAAPARASRRDPREQLRRADVRDLRVLEVAHEAERDLVGYLRGRKRAAHEETASRARAVDVKREPRDRLSTNSRLRAEHGPVRPSPGSARRTSRYRSSVGPDGRSDRPANRSAASHRSDSSRASRAIRRPPSRT